VRIPANRPRAESDLRNPEPRAAERAMPRGSTFARQNSSGLMRMRSVGETWNWSPAESLSEGLRAKQLPTAKGSYITRYIACVMPPELKPFGGAFHFFAKGDFKGLVLTMLEEKPMHGYEIMKAIEERFHGFLKPSAGAIYPALRALQSRGLVTVAGEERRKVYRITAKGRTFLRSRQSEIQKRMKAFAAAIGPERASLFEEMRATGRLLGSNIHDVTPVQAKKIRTAMVRTRKEILKILGD